MKSAVFLVGGLIGLIVGAGSLLFLQARDKQPDDMAIMFAPKNFYDSEAVVAVSGTLAGKGLGYPNNTFSIACIKDRKECWTSSVQAIGAQQIGRMDAPYEFEIRKWTPYEVVAVDDSAFGCFKTTITIERKTQNTLWVEEPINQSQPQCKSACGDND
ncbi:hypothetical protein [Bradyrhizobium genosp. P]|uniref:hypothetical protein n=1 Tax=Bradyrhizobium genosp. P TaxID=83641 RepID=UPI003CEFFF21